MLKKEKRLELNRKDYRKLLSDIDVVTLSVTDLVDLPGMQSVYVDTDLYIKSSEKKPDSAIELASYGQGAVSYPPTSEKQLPKLEASIKEDLVIALERHTVKKP